MWSAMCSHLNIVQHRTYRSHQFPKDTSQYRMNLLPQYAWNIPNYKKLHFCKISLHNLSPSKTSNLTTSDSNLALVDRSIKPTPQHQFLAVFQLPAVASHSRQSEKQRIDDISDSKFTQCCYNRT